MGPVAVAARGKGARRTVRRARDIGTRYGLGPRRMEECLATVLELVERHGCRATLPVTAVVLERNPAVIARYATRGIEFAVHGYTHVDHTSLAPSDQVEQLGRARRLFERNGIPPVGFRAPYLRSNHATLEAVRQNGFLYDGSQAVHWPVGPDLETDSYRRALDFCAALPAGECPVVPWSEDGIVRIPYCLPDDEAAVDRLGLTSAEAIGELWLAILRATHARGELFTLAVHPERIETCAGAIAAVLKAARAAGPPVWVARHDEIARWWRDRAASTVAVGDDGSGRLSVSIRGPAGLTVLARQLDVPALGPWSDGYVRVSSRRFDLHAETRPFIGVHPSSPSSLTTFLREQGYVVEVSESGGGYSCFLERARFTRADQRRVLAEIEEGAFPLLRLGRWPDGARSALSLTGDVDALTIRDYAMRFLGR